MEAAGERWDAVVVGGGPNGLAAALRLAESGWSVLVLEAAGQPGGGLRTVELLEPGCRHDVCATVHALTAVSPFMSRLSLDLVVPTAPLAHPFDDGSAVLLERSVEETALSLGSDGRAYRRLVGPITASADSLFRDPWGRCACHGIRSCSPESEYLGSSRPPGSPRWPSRDAGRERSLLVRPPTACCPSRSRSQPPSGW